MNILHVTPAHYPATYWGGPIFTVWQMNDRLARLPGVLLKVLTTDSAGQTVSERLTSEEMNLRMPYEIYFERRLAGASFSPGLLARLPSLLGWADVVHLTATYSFPTIPVLFGCWASRKPVVWSLHGALLDDLNRGHYSPQTRIKKVTKHIWNAVCRLLIRRDRSAVHVTTEQELEAARRFFPNARYEIIANGVDVPEILPAPRGPVVQGELRLIYLGRLAPKKGIENLLRAMLHLKQFAHLRIYGTGEDAYEKTLHALAEEYKLRNHVEFLGHVSGEAKTRAFVESDVCVIPSYSENFCIVVAEALAHSVPVIVSDRLSWQSVIEKGCGLVVPNDAESLCSAVDRIRRMDLEKMGRRGRVWMQQQFNWTRIAEQMRDVYRSFPTQKM